MTHLNFQSSRHGTLLARWLCVLLSVLLGLLACGLVLMVARSSDIVAHAEPLPGGQPKLILSTKTVTPTITAPGGGTLTYTIRLVNSGAWTATAASLTDVLPTSTTFISGSLQASSGTANVVGGVLTWNGDVNFDSAVAITYSASLDPAFTSGQVVNTAVVSNTQIANPITLTAVTTVTNVPILSISKVSAPAVPGPNKPLVYTLTVTNGGQPATSLPITVTDQVPSNTTFLGVGPGGVSSGGVVTWTRPVTLALGETTAFTFSVNVGDVPSGTVISNSNYEVIGPGSTITTGQLYTVTVVKPIFSLSKQTWPDPPGSNRELTYTLTLLNQGSLATSVVVTDRVPAGVTYVRGGTQAVGVVSWSLPSLDTGQSAQLTYTVYISDVAGLSIINNDYQACSSEGVCQAGPTLTSTIGGPTFQAMAFLDPIAKKPGGGGGPVTPTLVVRNLGPGNAINAQATLFFENISVSANDLYAIPAIGTAPPFPSGPACGGVSNCVSYVWVGSLDSGQAVTFTTSTGQNTIGGAEGTPYTATVVISDSLVNTTTVPITGTAVGKVTHFANVIPTKSAPPVIGRGQLLTYTINVYNGALSTDLPPVLTDSIPLSTTFVAASDGGVTQTLSNTTFVSWTLPLLGPGEAVNRTFTVQVGSNLVSGTQILNNNYAAFGYGNIVTGAVTSGPPVTTTVKEVGLIDSYKEVTPTAVLPGPGNLLTYVVHIVNSSAVPLTGVQVDDTLPWQSSTYQRNAVASAGSVISDIVTVHWTGDVAAFSSQVLTFTVLVDPDFKGAITNTAVITHPSLLNAVVVQAVGYVTDHPVLFISKSASPDPVPLGSELAYTLRVVNAGQQATTLVITDVVPANTQYVAGSATANGQLAGNQISWNIPVLKGGDSLTLGFRVKATSTNAVVNDRYAVISAEGVTAVGTPLTTTVSGGGKVYLPLVMK